VASGYRQGNSNSDAVAVPLTVTPAANSIAVEFAALDYSAPERNRYAYKLDGFDADWVETEAEPPAGRLHQPAARGLLPAVRGSNRNGVWTDTVLMVPIRVLPAWYQTIAFRILAGFALFALVAAVVQARTLYLRRARRELERLVIERTRSSGRASASWSRSPTCDTLTALPNRRMFMEEFRELLVLSGLQSWALRAAADRSRSPEAHQRYAGPRCSATPC